jgi:hypothetical protein
VKRTERGKKLLDEKERRVYLNARREQKERNALLLFRERLRKKKRRGRTTKAKSVRFVVLPSCFLLDFFERLLKREEEEQSLREIHRHDRRSAKRTTRGRGEEECDHHQY